MPAQLCAFPLVRTAFAAILTALCATTAFAAWPNNPATNVPVCTATDSQHRPVAVTDGAGGMIITWYDLRAGNYDIYAQRISGDGVPMWTANGVPVCTATNSQTNPVITTDGAGGAIIAWHDVRSGNTDIYAQRVNADGTTLWTSGGVALCTAADAQSDPCIASDGSGGAIVAWKDRRSGTNFDIYARRVNSAGTPQWTSNGAAVVTQTSDQSAPKIVADAAGGAYVAWSDARNGGEDIYLQQVNSLGTMLGTLNGIVVTAYGAPATLHRLGAMVEDGTGGVILGWRDNRTAAYHIYAQRFVSGPNRTWHPDGVEVCTAADYQSDVRACSDGLGGAIFAWEDVRSSDQQIYAQRLSANATALWTTNGIPLCSVTGIQSEITCAADGAGGALVAWSDVRSGYGYDVYTQRVSGAGTTLWTSNGVATLAAGSGQDNPFILSDGSAGALVVARDSRSVVNYDLYCQRVERYGQLGSPEPAISGVKDVKNDQGGLVKVSWSASYLDAEPTFGIFEYRLWRSVPSALAARQALARGVTADADAAARDGALLVSAAAPGYAWELAGTQAADALALYSLVTPTLSDSLPGSFPRTVFMVEARSSSSISADRWYSAPDSGYSVDNLAPAAPAPLTGQYAAGQTHLHWNPNTEPDLAGYRLYRGTSPAFTPSPATFVAGMADTGYADPAGAPHVYKLTAVDVHGNESPVATLIPGGTLGVGDAPATRMVLALAGANPARGASTLRYALAHAGHARLALYDAAGRRVRTLVATAQAAGEHTARWDGRNDAGGRVAAGLYFARLEAGGEVRHARIVRAD